MFLFIQENEVSQTNWLLFFFFALTELNLCDPISFPLLTLFCNWGQFKKGEEIGVRDWEDYRKDCDGLQRVSFKSRLSLVFLLSSKVFLLGILFKEYSTKMAFY